MSKLSGLSLPSLGKLSALPSLASKIPEKKEEKKIEEKVEEKKTVSPSPSPSTLPSISKLKGLKLTSTSAAAPVFEPPPKPIKDEKCANPPPNLEKDPKKHIDTFFGVRNGISGRPVEGINYTEETLTYMLSRNRADQITKIITDKMKELRNPIPFPMYECCTGIGGSTMGFLEDAFSETPNISSVTTYECDPERRAIFKRNVAMYGFDKRDILHVPETEFKGVPKDVSNAVLSMDPPWLPSHIRGNESTKDQYILSGMKLGDKTLEEWIADCTHCSLVAIRLPPGYKLNPVPGFVHENIPVKNSLLILSYPTIDLRKSILATESKKKELAREKESEIWRINLKKYLRNELLPKAINAPQYLDKLTDDENMKIWENAYTTKDYSPTHGENSEVLEMLGDKLLGFLYAKFLTESYPDVSEAHITDLIRHYLAKPFLASLASKLGMGNHIRSRIRTTIHGLEDAFEATFGALVTTGDTIKHGAGVGIAYNFFVSIFEGVDIDWELLKGPPKTQVKEIFETMGWINPKNKEKVPEEFFKDEYGNTSFKILFNSVALQQLKALGVDVKSPIVGESTQSTKTKASNDAYVNALANLESMGISKEWVKEYRERKEFENPNMAPYVAGVYARLTDEGFERFYIEGIKVGDQMYMQMIGVDKEGKKKVLAMNDKPIEPALLAKQMVLKEYATYNQ